MSRRLPSTTSPPPTLSTSSSTDISLPTPTSTSTDASQTTISRTTAKLYASKMADDNDTKADSKTNEQNDRQDTAQTAVVKSEQTSPQSTRSKNSSSSNKSKCRKPEHDASSNGIRGSSGKKGSIPAEASVRTRSREQGNGGSGSESGSSGDDVGRATVKRRAHRKKKQSVKTSKAGKGKETNSRQTKRRSNVTSSSEESEESDDESDDESSDESSDSDESPPIQKGKKKSGKKVGKPKPESDSDDSSSDEAPKHKKKSPKKTSKATKPESDTDDSSYEESSKPKKKPPKKSPKKTKKVDRSKKSKTAADTTEGTEEDAPVGTYGGMTAESINAQMAQLQAQLAAIQSPCKKRGKTSKQDKKEDRKSKTKDKTPDFSRVDQVWNSTLYKYELKESVEDDTSAYSEYAFLVRRRFDGENQYRDVMIDIRHKSLRTVLQEVMKDCKSVSLETEEPSIHPNTLFLYLDELREFNKKTLKTRIAAEKKKKAIKELQLQRALCKTLVGYLDEDYAQTKKTLYPLLAAGNITYDLLWALFKPNEIAITSSYGNWDEPRCFKVDMANNYKTMARTWYAIDGKYLDYDGKQFGMGDFEAEVDTFKGPRKITSLAAYPLKYHKDPEAAKKLIIERGRKFVALEGMNYRFHKGMAFMKKKKQVAKININGRIMVDPATFRRINPNYPISIIKPHEGEGLISDDDDVEDSDCGCCGSDSDSEAHLADQKLEQNPFGDDAPKTKLKPVEQKDGSVEFVEVEVDENGDPIRPNKVEALEPTAAKTYTDEQLLLTTSVVYGFAFSEKLWLEFTVSGLHDIVYNKNAFDSLVLPPNQKSIVRALVESHKFHAAKAIDDVVQGKGKGLVSVLHGPPGTGKTLTAEGISELLRCPLYMVSAGELGTDPAKLEYELQKILDIAHSWGAVLLLDEADVFLEKREVHDIHRNALVSIFLRLLEYFQGILFLTTNRVATFDEAFQSRIHVALRYGELTQKARKTVWTQFIEMVRKHGGCEVGDLSDADLQDLSRHTLNGRQIKNAVRTAQALALNEKANLLTIEHIKRVLDVQQSFDHDLKGGTGYMDAMRSYT